MFKLFHNQKSFLLYVIIITELKDSMCENNTLKIHQKSFFTLSEVPSYDQKSSVMYKITRLSKVFKSFSLCLKALVKTSTMQISIKSEPISFSSI